MSNAEELRKRFEDNFVSHPHEDDDYGICASHISVCSKCKKEFYYLNLEKCKCKAPCVQKPCTCGADKIKEEQFEWLLSEIEAAEKAKEEQIEKDYIAWVFHNSYGDSRPYKGETPFAKWKTKAEAQDMSDWK